jgi:putative Holliday junction resolvase
MSPTQRIQPQVILAFDFGMRRIGVASGDTLTRTAHALMTLERRPGTPWQGIGALIVDYSPARLIVGIPYNMDGSETLLTGASRGFAEELSRRYDLPVTPVDERLSSRDAATQLRAARAAGLKRRRTTHADVDSVAAKVLLERWYDNPIATGGSARHDAPGTDER